MSIFKRGFAIAALLIVLPVIVYALNAIAGMRAVAQSSGTIHMSGLIAPVRIVRDSRDIPHISAQNDHDLYFAQGYAEASDRLFQMDLIRRFVTGRLAEVLGGAALPADEHARIAPIAQIVRSEWAHLKPPYRANLQAFSDGVNAAMRKQPLPLEFRLLLYKPDPWTPQDSLAAGFSTVLDLIDNWDDVVRRDNIRQTMGARLQHDLYPITDPAYDAPTAGGGIQPVPRISDRRPQGVILRNRSTGDARSGEYSRHASNEWALGADRSKSGHALLANDPHLRLGIPGVWYLLELRGPDVHVAGGTLPGVPGVVLGHNEHIAWGATNGTVVTEVVYRDSMQHATARPETFHVRFGKDVHRTYLSTVHGFAIDGKRGLVVDWNAVRVPLSPLPAFDALNRAATIGEALRALRSYPGPPQNFVIASTDGSVAYHLAGLVPDDPSWGRRVHARKDPLYGFVPFVKLPHVDPSRDARVFTANNRMYGAAYSFRLSAQFSAPYRAKRIQQLLSRKLHYSVADMFHMQSDTLSLPERELASDILKAAARKHMLAERSLKPYLDALRSWNGRFEPDSRAASLMYAFRRRAIANLAAYNTGSMYEDYIKSAQNADFILLMRVLRERPRGWWPKSDYDGLLVRTLREIIRKHGTHLLDPWREVGAVHVNHPLASLGLTFLNGGVLPGDGDAYSLHVLTPSPHSQSFRAAWDTGDWDAGGMIVPSGESGEQGSGHYTDLRTSWLAQKLVPLPFSARALAKAARQTLILTPL